MCPVWGGKTARLSAVPLRELLLHRALFVPSLSLCKEEEKSRDLAFYPATVSFSPIYQAHSFIAPTTHSLKA